MGKDSEVMVDIAVAEIEDVSVEAGPRGAALPLGAEVIEEKGQSSNVCCLDCLSHSRL